MLFHLFVGSARQRVVACYIILAFRTVGKGGVQPGEHKEAGDSREDERVVDSQDGHPPDSLAHEHAVRQAAAHLFFRDLTRGHSHTHERTVEFRKFRFLLGS